MRNYDQIKADPLGPFLFVLNVIFWTDFPVLNNARGRLCMGCERQVTDRTRSFSLGLYNQTLNDRSGTKGDLQRCLCESGMHLQPPL